MILTHKREAVFFNWAITGVDFRGNDVLVTGNLQFGDQTVSGIGQATTAARAAIEAFQQAATHLIGDVEIRRSSVVVLPEGEAYGCCGRTE